MILLKEEGLLAKFRYTILLTSYIDHNLKGFVVQFTNLASIMWAGFIALMVFLVVNCEKNLNEINKYEKIGHVVIWGISLATSIAVLTIDDSNGRALGSADLW